MRHCEELYLSYSAYFVCVCGKVRLLEKVEIQIVYIKSKKAFLKNL